MKDLQMCYKRATVEATASTTARKLKEENAGAFQEVSVRTVSHHFKQVRLKEPQANQEASSYESAEG